MKQRNLKFLIYDMQYLCLIKAQFRDNIVVNGKFIKYFNILAKINRRKFSVENTRAFYNLSRVLSRFLKLGQDN